MVTSHACAVVTILSYLLHGSTGYFMYVASPPRRTSTRMPPQHEFELSRSPFVSAPARTVLHPAGFVSKPPRLEPAVARSESYRASGPTFAPPPAEPRMVSSEHIRRRQRPHPPPQPTYTFSTEEPRLKKPHRKVSSTVTENEIAEMVAELEAEKEQEQKLADILPRVTFDCKSRSEGYYADMEFACEVFHYCGKPDGRRFTFFCPPGSRFNQIHMICDYDKFQGCDNSEDYYHLNDNLYPKEEKPDRTLENQVIPKPAPPPRAVPTPHRMHHSSPRPASIPLAPVPQHLKQASNNIIHSTLRPVKSKPKSKSHLRSTPNNRQMPFIAARSSEEDAIMTPAPRKRQHHRNHEPTHQQAPRHHPSKDRRPQEGFMPQRPQIQGPLHPSGSHRSPVQMMMDDNDIGPMGHRFMSHGDQRPPPHHPHHPHHHHHPPPHPMHRHPPHPGFVEGRNEHSNEEFDSGFPGLPISFQRGGTFGRPMPERPRISPATFESPHEHFRLAGSHNHHHHHQRPPHFEYEEFDEPHFLPSPSALVQRKPNPQETHKSKPHDKPRSKQHPPHSESHSQHHSTPRPQHHSSSHSSPRPRHHSSPHSHANHNVDSRLRQLPPPPTHNHIPPSEHHKRPTHHAKPMQTPQKYRSRPAASDEVIKEESMRESLRHHPPPNPHLTSETREHRRPKPSEKHNQHRTSETREQRRLRPSDKPTPDASTARTPQHHKPKPESWHPVLTTHRPNSRNQHRQHHATTSVTTRERHSESPLADEETIEYTSNLEVRARPRQEPSPKPQILKPYPNEDEWGIEKQIASAESREEFARTRTIEKPGDSIKSTTHSPSGNNNRIRHEYKAAPLWDGKRTTVEAMTSDEEPKLAETIETSRVTKLSDSSEKIHRAKMPQSSARTHPTNSGKTTSAENHVHRTRKPSATTSRKPANRPSFRSTARTTTTTAPASEEFSEEDESPVPIATTSSTSAPTSPATTPATDPSPKHVASHRGIQRKRIQSSSIGGRMNNWPLHNRPSYKRKQATTTSSPTPSEETSSEEAETTTATTTRTTHRPRRTRPPLKAHHGRTRTRAPAIEPTETTPTSTVQTTPLTPEKLTQTTDDEAGGDHFEVTAHASDRSDQEEKKYLL